MKTEELRIVVALCLLAAFNAPAAVRYVDVNSANPTPPYTDWATAAAIIQDAVDVADPEDQIIVTNGVYQSGGRIAVGTGSGSGSNRVAVTKPLVLQSVNGPEYTVIQAYSSPVTNLGVGAMRCVYLTNGASLSGFTLANGATWAPWGAGVWGQSSNLVVVSNCVLVGNFAGTRGAGAYGGTLVDCVIRSNSTPPVSSAGGGAYGSILVNCTLVGNASGQGGGAYGATLTNCTLIGNSAANGGGGAYGGALNLCMVLSNSAVVGGGTYGAYLSNSTLSANSATYGGGGFGGTLVGCTLIENTAEIHGGGSDQGILNNCRLYRNRAYRGGGTYLGTLRNCTLYFNEGAEGAGAYGGAVNNSILYWNWGSGPNSLNHLGSTLNYSCATPLPIAGTGNITNEPLFVGTYYYGPDLRLQSNSPCVNAGNNAYASVGTDIDGNPRIAGGTVDMGAYEFQSPASVLSYAWAQHYGLPTDGSADYSDADRDRLNNWQEWIAGTVPTDALSALRLLTPINDASGITVSWQSVGNRTYFLERASNLGDQPAFSLLTSNIAGQLGTTSYTDTNTVGSGSFFYRVGVQP